MILIKMLTEFNASIIQSKGNGGEKRRHLLCSAKKKQQKNPKKTNKNTPGLTFQS